MSKMVRKIVSVQTPEGLMRHLSKPKPAKEVNFIVALRLQGNLCVMMEDDCSLSTWKTEAEAEEEMAEHELFANAGYQIIKVTV